MNSGSRAKRLHYAWVIAGVTFLVLLVTAGIRATPGVLMVPLESEFGWTSAAISLAIAINLALFGLIGPFAASLMDRWGLRRILLCALALLTMSVALTTFMRTQWQLTLLGGVCVASGTGVTSIVLAAVIANRWFEQHRGLVLGVLTAANATGQLLFLPVLARLLEISGWRSVALLVAASAAAVVVLVGPLRRARPSDLGLVRYGEVLATAAAGGTPAAPKPVPTALMPLAAVALVRRSAAVWVLAGSFFVCGASTNGLIGTHLIPACHDFGIPEVRAAGLLAMMGVFDIIGTTISGWLSDRFSSRYLLFIYYALRGLSLLCLPYTLVQGSSELKWVAVFYGLDWVATVPPTVRLTADLFGRHNAGVVFGWIADAHQLGAAPAALGSGAIRTSFGDYRPAFWISGTICLLAGLSFLFTRRLLDQRGAGAAAPPIMPLPSAALGS